jgi:hypothetical protein
MLTGEQIQLVHCLAEAQHAPPVEWVLARTPTSRS